MTRREPAIVVDATHLGRRASGIERVTEELFSPEALAPLPVACVRSRPRRASMIAAQMLSLPATALTQPRSVFLFPGFPPSPVFALLRERTVMYVHDVFLLTRTQDLNAAGKAYMAAPFARAVRRLRYFFTNSLTTARALQPFALDDAEIRTYRPPVRNVFGLKPTTGTCPGDAGPIRVVSIGTIEPRKNLPAAANICFELSRRLARPVELNVVGRRGWGPDHDHLARQPHVRLHGFLGDEGVRAIIGSSDLYLCTSHDEGLGLPLLEVQYSGLPVVAPDKPVFREVLSSSGTFVDPASPEEAAATIAAVLSNTNWRQRAPALATANIVRWNAAAGGDRSDAIELLSKLLLRAAADHDVERVSYANSRSA